MSGNKCPSCKGLGITSGRRWLSLVVAELLATGDASWHQRAYHSNWFDDTLEDEDGCHPNHDLGDLCTALAGREPDRLVGHDEMDKWEASDKIIKAAGFDPQVWGVCQECKGEGAIE